MATTPSQVTPKLSKWVSKSTIRRMDRAAYQAYSDSHRGEFIALPVGSGFGFARCRGSVDFAFYDLHAPEIRPIEEIKRHPILFTLCCNSRHLARGLWKVIGYEPLEPDLAAPVMFAQNPTGTDFVEICDDGKLRPYAGEDLTKLEQLLIYDNPDQVEERLRKHFAGEPDDRAYTYRVSRDLAERVYREYWAKRGGEGKG